MPRHTKIIIVSLGVAALTVHFTMILFYPYGRDAKSKTDFYSLAYIYPFFQQSWQLFAPPPSSNYHLFVEYENSGPRKKDLFQEILIQHQSNRLLGYEPLVIAFTNSIHYFEKNTEQKLPVNGPIKDDLYFKMIEHSALNYLRHKYGIKQGLVKLILLVEDVPAKSSRVYFN